ncbi:MAG TPA: hypothetical protein VL087_08805 [Nitrospirota bacterium]|nr:hypothetical protein [Nitrospirota bacterium]
MFTVDTTITDLKVKERSMLKVLFSMNTHQVATPEMNLEEARSYVIFCREGGGRISAYIGLHLLGTNRRLFYPHSSNPFPEEDMNTVDEEARGFAEGMGAMLDEIDLTKMSSDERNHWIDDQAIFNLNKQIEGKPVEQSAVPATGSLEQPAAPAVQPHDSVALAVPVSTASDAKPEPAAKPQEAAAPAVPVSTASVAQPAPVDQPQEVAVPAAPAHTIPAPPAPEPPQPPPVKPRQPERPASAPMKTAQQVSAKQPEDVIQRAIRAGVVRAPKPQLSKESRSTNGIVSRDKEALARLLSSF